MATKKRQQTINKRNRERAIEDGVRCRLVGTDLVHERFLVGLAERHGTETQVRHFDARGAKVAILHGASLSVTES